MKCASLCIAPRNPARGMRLSSDCGDLAVSKQHTVANGTPTYVPRVPSAGQTLWQSVPGVSFQDADFLLGGSWTIHHAVRSVRPPSSMREGLVCLSPGFSSRLSFRLSLSSSQSLPRLSLLRTLIHLPASAPVHARLCVCPIVPIGAPVQKATLLQEMLGEFRVSARRNACLHTPSCRKGCGRQRT